MAGRVSKLADPDFAQCVAELYVNGTSQVNMAAELDVSRTTIIQYIKDPRVQARARRLASERVHRISRRIDNEIEARLREVEEWDMDTIIKVRKEMIERPLKLEEGEGGDIGKATNELAEAMDQDPKFQALLEQFVANRE